MKQDEQKMEASAGTNTSSDATRGSRSWRLRPRDGEMALSHCPAEMDHMAMAPMEPYWTPKVVVFRLRPSNFFGVYLQ